MKGLIWITPLKLPILINIEEDKVSREQPIFSAPLMTESTENFYGEQSLYRLELTSKKFLSLKPSMYLELILLLSEMCKIDLYVNY